MVMVRISTDGRRSAGGGSIMLGVVVESDLLQDRRVLREHDLLTQSGQLLTQGLTLRFTFHSLLAQLLSAPGDLGPQLIALALHVNDVKDPQSAHFSAQGLPFFSGFACFSPGAE